MLTCNGNHLNQKAINWQIWPNKAEKYKTLFYVLSNKFDLIHQKNFCIDMIVYVKVLLYSKITNDMNGTVTLSVFGILQKDCPKAKIENQLISKFLNWFSILIVGQLSFRLETLEATFVGSCLIRRKADWSES